MKLEEIKKAIKYYVLKSSFKNDLDINIDDISIYHSSSNYQFSCDKILTTSPNAKYNSFGVISNNHVFCVVNILIYMKDLSIINKKYYVNYSLIDKIIYIHIKYISKDKKNSEKIIDFEDMHVFEQEEYDLINDYNKIETKNKIKVLK